MINNADKIQFSLVASSDSETRTIHGTIRRGELASGRLFFEAEIPSASDLAAEHENQDAAMLAVLAKYLRVKHMYFGDDKIESTGSTLPAEPGSII